MKDYRTWWRRGWEVFETLRILRKNATSEYHVCSFDEPKLRAMNTHKSDSDECDCFWEQVWAIEQGLA